MTCAQLARCKTNKKKLSNKILSLVTVLTMSHCVQVILLHKGIQRADDMLGAVAHKTKEENRSFHSGYIFDFTMD